MPPEAADGADAPSVPVSDAATSHESAADGARIVGAIDLVKGHRVAGWALDRAHPDVPLEVEIRRAGAPIARARADRHRRDFEKAGIGTGRHGFEVTLEASDELPGPDSLEAVALDQAGRAVPLVNRAAASARSPNGQAPIATEVRILADEVRGLGVALRAALAAPAPRSAASAELPPAIVEAMRELAERFGERLNAIEIVQARLEATLAAAEARTGQGGGRTPRGLILGVGCLVLLSLASLGLGIHSLFG